MKSHFSGTFPRHRFTVARSSKRHANPALVVEALEPRQLLTAAPNNLVALATGASSIHLSWNAVNDPSVTSYDIITQVWVHTAGGGSGRGGGGGSGHWTYPVVASHVSGTSYTVGATAGYHTYWVQADSANGNSIWSAPASAQTWAAPVNGYGNEYLLTSGAVFSGPINVTVGQSVRIDSLVSGNPLTFTETSGVPGVSFVGNAITYTPRAQDVGTQNITITASNALGSVAQTFQYIVQPGPVGITPTIKFTNTTQTFNGGPLGVAVAVYKADGVTPVAGTTSIVYGGGVQPVNPGTYNALVNFTSSDPAYADATAIGTFTITKGASKFLLSSTPTITVGTSVTTISGHIGGASAYTVVNSGDIVTLTLNGVSKSATVDASGNFSVGLPTASLPVGSATVSYSFYGDSLYTGATATSSINVIPTAAPKITLQPVDQIATAGDPVTFTVVVSGSPSPSIQWQYSTDGGQTWINATGLYANSTSYSLTASSGIDGWKFRAIVTNSVGSVISNVATFTLDTGL